MVSSDELAHVYLFISNGYPPGGLPLNICDENEASELSTTDYLLNVANNVMYVSSTSNFPFPIPCKLCSSSTNIIKASDLISAAASDS